MAYGKSSKSSGRRAGYSGRGSSGKTKSRARSSSRASSGGIHTVRIVMEQAPAAGVARVDGTSGYPFVAPQPKQRGKAKR